MHSTALQFILNYVGPCCRFYKQRNDIRFRYSAMNSLKINELGNQIIWLQLYFFISLGLSSMEIVVTSARDSLRNLNLDSDIGTSYPQSMFQTGYSQSSSRSTYPQSSLAQYTFTDSMDSMKMPNLNSFPGRYGNVLIS